MGDVGFADFRREAEPLISCVPEAGWVLSSWAHGRGLGNEAVAAAVDWLDRETDHHRVVCLIAHENIASNKIAIRNGFAASAAIRLAGQEIPFWSRNRSLSNG